MLTSRLQASPASQTGAPARSSASPHARAVNGSAKRSPNEAASTRQRPHLILQQPAWAPADEGRRKRNRAAVKTKRDLKVRGEIKSMLALFSTVAAFGACGVIYLAAYAGVAAQSHQITLLQQQLSAAQAQHEVYVQQLTVLSSATRIQALAQQQGMVMSDNAHYLTLTASGQDGAAVSQIVSAR